MSRALRTDVKKYERCLARVVWLALTQQNQKSNGNFNSNGGNRHFLAVSLNAVISREVTPESQKFPVNSLPLKQNCGIWAEFEHFELEI